MSGFQLRFDLGSASRLYTISKFEPAFGIQITFRLCKLFYIDMRRFHTPFLDVHGVSRERT